MFETAAIVPHGTVAPGSACNYCLLYIDKKERAPPKTGGLIPVAPVSLSRPVMTHAPSTLRTSGSTNLTELKYIVYPNDDDLRTYYAYVSRPPYYVVR